MKSRKKIYVLLFAVFCGLSVAGQNAAFEIPANIKLEEDSKIYRIVETPPEFPGGDAELLKFIANNIKYPPAMVEMVISGRVIAGFIVEKDGSINIIEIVHSLHPLFDAETMRVIKQMPKWEPGQLNGKPVRMYYLMPVNIDFQY